MSMDQLYAKKSYSYIRLWRKLLFHIATNMPFLKGEFRSKIHKVAGVNILIPKKTFIGKDVFFDDLNPEDITIEEGVFITSGCKILTHFIDPSWGDFNHMKRGKVYICKNVFIGMNVVIVKPVTIGESSIIGANSVITKDIPPFEIWGGNPAILIQKRIIRYNLENE